MKTLEEILTAEELARLIQMYDPEFGRNVVNSIGHWNFTQLDRVILMGDVLTSEGTCLLPPLPNYAIDMFPRSNQKLLGTFTFYVLTGNRRLVEFTPAPEFNTHIPNGYVVRNEEDETVSFSVLQFPFLEWGETKNPFMCITPIDRGRDATNLNKVLFEQKFRGSCFITQKDGEPIFLGINLCQWNVIWRMLNTWVMK